MIIYDIFFLIFSIIYLPYLAFKSKAHEDFSERFGLLPHLKDVGKLRPLWIHAVSVGEVLAVKDFIGKIKSEFPERKIVLSTTTKTGNDIAKKVLPRDVDKFYFPLDFSFTVKKTLNTINPSSVLILETEIWPNLIIELSKRNIPVAIINGRLSDKSFKGYKKIRFFMKGILERINLFCMQSVEDAERIKKLGAPQERVKVTGNMKLDIKTFPEPFDKSELGIKEGDELLVAGSTHKGEDEIVLDIYKNLLDKMPNLRLLIAPRHIDKADVIKKIAEEKGFKALLRSSVKKGHTGKKEVIILDTMGELSRIYSLATIVFMGGSLIKRGGHNLVEPAIFKKPIVFGHYMFNFRDMAKLFLERNAAREVKDENALFDTLKSLFEDSEKRALLGQNARKIIEDSKGAIQKNTNVLASLLGGAR